MAPQTLIHLLEFLYTGTAFFDPMALQALDVVAEQLKLDYLSQWCSKVKINQIKSLLPPDPDILFGKKAFFVPIFIFRLEKSFRKSLCKRHFVFYTRHNYPCSQGNFEC